ncbi:MAG: hypothetical protein DME21_09035 [Verrucomicrobia bacterium]|nr:MAG: hypothetical protein DME21_09035 [Verrucomicrobiota bacterium]
MNVHRTEMLQRRIRLLTWFFIIGLVLSGATAVPLQWELDLSARILGVADSPSGEATSGLSEWILKVRDALRDTNAKYPFVAYGFDWLAFGHFAIAIAFVGALRDPVRNAWLFQFGMIACVLVVPYAFVFGAVRGIPIYWRLIDCSFGVLGFIPLRLCYRWTKELDTIANPAATKLSHARSSP